MSRALGRLKRWNKIEKTESGNWRLNEKLDWAVSENEVVNDQSANKPVDKANRPEIEIEAAAEVVTDDIQTALLRVANRFNRFGEVSNLEDKLYTLEFLGKLLDPTIDKVFQSIADDLRRLNGDV